MPVLRRGCQECASAAFVAQREKRVPPADASQSGIAGKDEPDGGVTAYACHGDDVCVLLFCLYLFMLAGADVHGYRTGRGFRIIRVEYR